MTSAPAPRRKVIIDTDCGTDDALAIMLALTDPTVDILAFTCVAGNCSVTGKPSFFAQSTSDFYAFMQLSLYKYKVLSLIWI